MSGEPFKIEPAKVRTARRAVAETRAAMLDTLGEIRERLQPKTLVGDAWAKAKDKGADLAEDAVDAVKARPVAVGGAIAALAMFLAREPIRDGVRNLYGAMTSSPRKQPSPARPPVKRRARKARPAANTEK